MGHISLFRKYRPMNFEELVGQEHITKTLKNALEARRIGHAYLFCGPRGTGKTSSARIFAKALNCDKGITPSPCNKCDMCISINNGSALDIIELDAASNTQVDKVREFIIQKVSFAPTRGRYKAYIIDEVHKLSDASFNALLKTLEEPPKHTIFILATTHPHELLPTILSRCQRFDFKRITQTEITSYLRKVADDEKLKIEEGALGLIAGHSEGSLRDAMVILEQLFSYASTDIKASHVSELLGLTDSEVLFDFSDVLAQNDTVRALELVDELVSKGSDIEKLGQELIEFYRRLLVAKVSYDKILNEFGEDYVNKIKEHAGRYSATRIMNILKILIDLKSRIKDTSINRILWEMAIVKITKWETEPSLDKMAERLTKLEEAVKNISPQNIKEEKKEIAKKAAAESRLVKAAKEKEPCSEKIKDVLGEDEWQRIMQVVKKEKVSLYAILVEAKPLFDGNKVKLNFKKGYDFHKDKALESKNYLAEIIEKHLQKNIGIEAAVTEEKDEDAEDNQHTQLVKDVMDVFG
ncbi:MAG: DNA polymerase III subunit gamma/tau [Armatimonadota bacterium]